MVANHCELFQTVRETALLVTHCGTVKTNSTASLPIALHFVYIPSLLPPNVIALSFCFVLKTYFSSRDNACVGLVV